MTKKDYEIFAKKSWDDTLNDLTLNFKIMLKQSVAEISARYSWRIWVAKKLINWAGKLLQCQIFIDVDYKQD